MCLLIVESRLDPHTPLVVAANRDERLDRPATPMTVLRDAAPRIIGGRDDVAGGTWLAVNEAGVVAALTNRPGSVKGTLDGPPPELPPRRAHSRGELPLLLARHTTARDAVAAFEAHVRPEDYDGAWFLVGDRATLYAIDLSGGALRTEALGPGRYVLENHPLGAPSVKVDRVRHLLDASNPDGEHRTASLARILADHEMPWGSPTNDDTEPRIILPACVHSAWYGTRWSAIVTVTDIGLPHVQYADGAPCVTEMRSADDYWHAPSRPTSLD